MGFSIGVEGYVCMFLFVSILINAVQVLVHYPLMLELSFTQFVVKSSLSAFVKLMEIRYRRIYDDFPKDKTAFMAKSTFCKVFEAWTQVVDPDCLPFTCVQCKHSPPALIWDGVEVGIKKFRLLPTARPLLEPDAQNSPNRYVSVNIGNGHLYFAPDQHHLPSELWCQSGPPDYNCTILSWGKNTKRQRMRK